MDACKAAQRGIQRGFTLLEMMATVSVASIALTIAIPAMQQTFLRRQLEGAASEVYNNLLLMRSQAINKNRNAYVNFTGSGTDWRYGLDDSASCDPAASGDCAVSGSERVYAGSQWKSVTLNQNFAGNELSFEPRRGTASAPGMVTLTSPAGEIRVRISPIAYISICSVGPQRLGGYAECS